MLPGMHSSDRSTDLFWSRLVADSYQISFVYFCKNCFVKNFPRTMKICVCFFLFLNYCRDIVRVCCKVRICNPQSSGLYWCEELETAFCVPCKIKFYYKKMKVCAMLNHIGLGSLAVNVYIVDLTMVYLSTIKDFVTKDTHSLCST